MSFLHALVVVSLGSVRGDGRGLMALLFFLVAACPGFWAPVIANVLAARGWDEWLELTLLVPPLGAILSPLILGALADQRLAAQKVLAAITFGNAIMTAAAFWLLERATSPALFLACLAVKALVSAPTWSILTSVVLNNLNDPESMFGRVRVWGTVGWMVAGWTVSWIGWDESARTGYLAAAVLFGTGFICLFLPDTPPVKVPNRTWKEALGFGAFRAFENRDTAVYFLTALIFAVPLAAYYPYTALYLKEVGVKQVAFSLSIGQLTEIVAMLAMGMLFRRARLKVMFALAIGAGLVRYLCYLLAGDGSMAVTLIIAGIFMHGICWTLFFETGRVFINRRVDTDLRSQAQALMTVLSGGVGPATGYLISGALYRWCVKGDGPGWVGFWGVMSALVVVALVFFLVGYRGIRHQASPR
ncbi:MAG: MFS transporter [Verrucomicrobiota bacterium JB023]|nr:MFS transporter [Verrucomicrobiota bacterium JB023]